jgi:hypothetical protein
MSDGRYYAQGRRVYRAPLKTETGTSLGFLVCECNEDVQGAAEEIVEALNAAEDARNKPLYEDCEAG